MGEERKSIYGELQNKLPVWLSVGDFVRAYAKAYLEADVETIKRLQELLLNDEELMLGDASGFNEPDALVGSPVKPQPHLNSGAVALPEPDNPDTDQLLNS
jgi:hypothetical protein